MSKQIGKSQRSKEIEVSDAMEDYITSNSISLQPSIDGNLELGQCASENIEETARHDLHPQDSILISPIDIERDEVDDENSYDFEQENTQEPQPEHSDLQLEATTQNTLLQPSRVRSFIENAKQVALIIGVTLGGFAFLALCNLSQTYVSLRARLESEPLYVIYDFSQAYTIWSVIWLVFMSLASIAILSLLRYSQDTRLLKRICLFAALLFSTSVSIGNIHAIRYYQDNNNYVIDNTILERQETRNLARLDKAIDIIENKVAVSDTLLTLVNEDNKGYYLTSRMSTASFGRGASSDNFIQGYEIHTDFPKTQIYAKWYISAICIVEVRHDGDSTELSGASENYADGLPYDVLNVYKSICNNFFEGSAPGQISQEKLVEILQEAKLQMLQIQSALEERQDDDDIQVVAWDLFVLDTIFKSVRMSKGYTTTIPNFFGRTLTLAHALIATIILAYLIPKLKDLVEYFLPQQNTPTT